jgi:hypothetical protein
VRLLAKEVNRRIKKEDRDTALEQTLAMVIPQIISADRYHTRPPSGQGVADTQRMPAAGGPQSSRKVAAIRAANGWRTILNNTWINTGPATSDYKPLRDCTIADLTYSTSMKRTHISRVTAVLDLEDRLISLCTEHDVNRVSQLPEAVLAEVLGGAR